MEYCRYKQEVKKNKHNADLKKIRSYLLNTGVLVATDQELTLAWYEFSDDLGSGWMDVSDELLLPFSEWLEGYQRSRRVPFLTDWIRRVVNAWGMDIGSEKLVFF